MNMVLPLRIEGRILTIRGQRVMIDADLAELYDVPTKALNLAVKRNVLRFPTDFMFQLDPNEKAEVVTNCDHLARLKFSKTLPFAFTEFGAIALANVLASPQAIEMGIYVVRAFVQLRQAAATHADLAQRLTDLEMKVEGMKVEEFPAQVAQVAIWLADHQMNVEAGTAYGEPMLRVPLNTSLRKSLIFACPA